ncbi:hypothetical protein BDM02DRAFT_3184567 [Thelephora ganbajun]|uniref:Uncharacterized protein n=1 Tax=Thelephora ganbajun TaxID=370292 RepID=A0ACB6ZP50_THEGA|nr:hypothetical protein BDM02DRAFT_3184567 [Thelephora ganbajun]
MEAFTILDPVEESIEPVIPRVHPQSNSLENPFLVQFTPSKQMNVLQASLMSNSATSYLVSGSPIPQDAHVITPQPKVPEPFPEPDWEMLLNLDITHLGTDNLTHTVSKLQRGLQMARDCICTREAIIKSAHATNVILELTCQHQQAAPHQKEAKEQEKIDKHTLFGDGKGHVVTDDDFVALLEEIKEKKEKEVEKERRKLDHTKVKESKVAEKEAWEQALEKWKEEKELWEEYSKLRRSGCWVKDLPNAPKRPRKAEVVAVACSEGSSGDSKDGGSNEEIDGDGDSVDGQNGEEVGSEDGVDEEEDSNKDNE